MNNRLDGVIPSMSEPKMSEPKMLEAYEITHRHEGDVLLKVVLSFDERQKSRYKTQTSCGQTFGWFLERGYVLSDKDVLKCDDGTLIEIECAPEAVSDIKSDDILLLTKAAYHLGNRHVSLHVNLGYLRYQQDYVLDDMVRGLGLNVTHTQAPFHPESGAYTGTHSHKHDNHH